MKPKSLIIRILSASLVLQFASILHGQTPQNPLPISGPTTITAPGYYRLTRNIITGATSGNIITVQSSNVTIDLNTFFMNGPTGPGSNLVGIFANEYGNITIKNGSIAYCKVGIQLTGNNNSATTRNINHVIDNMRITRCFQYGVFFPVVSPGSVVSNCLFSQIGGSTAGGSFSIAVYGLGSYILTKDNVISRVDGPSGSPTSSYGVSTLGPTVRNVISDSNIGVDSGKYQNNLTTNVTTPFQNGTDAGGNN